MLISEQPRFIFIHIYKNAGTSIKKALRSYQKKSSYSPLLQPEYRHSKATEVIKQIGRENFQSYFSFAVVRNPWSWQVSLYQYMRNKKHHPQHAIVKDLSFSDYLQWRCNQDLHLQKDFVYDEYNQQLVDRILHFERLKKDFKAICLQLGIKRNKLPHLNSSGNRRPYQSFYTTNDIELVRSTFRADIEMFGYQFKPRTSILL